MNDELITVSSDSPLIMKAPFWLCALFPTATQLMHVSFAPMWAAKAPPLYALFDKNDTFRNKMAAPESAHAAPPSITSACTAPSSGLVFRRNTVSTTVASPPAMTTNTAPVPGQEFVDPTFSMKRHRTISVLWSSFGMLDSYTKSAMPVF